jgi:AraC-like DNA-binding protein
MYGFKEFITSKGSDHDLISAYLHSQNKISEIAQQFGKSEAEVYRILRSNDISPNRLKVNHEKVQYLSSLGWGIKEIAGMTGYTTRNVRYILKNLVEGK